MQANSAAPRPTKTVLVSLTHDTASRCIVISAASGPPRAVVEAAQPEVYRALAALVDDPTVPHSEPSTGFDPKRFFSGLVELIQDRGSDQ